MKMAWLIVGFVAMLVAAFAVGTAETPRSYRGKVERILDEKDTELERFRKHAVPYSQADAIWETRASMDIELVRSHLRGFHAGREPKSEVERALRQLDRDMEDYPPADCSTLASIGRASRECEDARQ